MKLRILLAGLFFLSSCTTMQKSTSGDFVSRLPQSVGSGKRFSLTGGKNFKAVEDQKNSGKDFFRAEAMKSPTSAPKMAAAARQGTPFPFADAAPLKKENYSSIRKLKGSQVPQRKFLVSEAEQQGSKRKSLRYGPKLRKTGSAKNATVSAKSGAVDVEKPVIENAIAIEKSKEVTTENPGPWRSTVYKSAVKAKPGREVDENIARQAAANATAKVKPSNVQPKISSYYDDEYEPNDYQSSAYNLVNDENVWLYDVDGYGYQCDDDWYKVYVEPGYQNLYLETVFDHYEGDIDMKLYDSSGYVVASAGNTSSADTEYIDVNLNYPGYYYVKLYYGNDCNSYDFQWSTYRYGSLGPDAYEDNDSYYYATHLESYENVWLSSINGWATQADDDWYEVEVERGYQRILVDTKFFNSEGDIDIALYDDAGYIRLASSTHTWDDEDLDFNIPNSYFTSNQYRKFYIRIYGANRGNKYDMRWYTAEYGDKFTDDGYEPNDYRTSAYPIPQGSLGITGTEMDEDWFYFDVSQENQRKIQIQLASITNRGDIDLYLYNSNGTRVASAATYSTNEFIEYTVPTTGRYYILVTGSHLATVYSLRWTSLPSGYYEDNYEPNDSRTSPYDISAREETWLSGIMGYGANYNDDFYRIRVYPNYLSLNIDLRYNYTATEGNVDMELINPRSGQVVASSRSTGSDDFISTVVNEPGDYIVRVYGDNKGNRYDLRWMSFNNAASVGVGHSGAWYNPATSGQGFFMTDITRDNGSHEFVVAWYTFDTTQTAPGDKKMWIFGQGPIVNGEAQVTLSMAKGGTFFSNASTTFPTWGTGTFKVTDCANGTFSYNNTLPDAAGKTYTGTIPLSKLTPAFIGSDGRNICSGQTQAVHPSSNVKYGHSGAWYAPEHDRQGYFIDIYPQSDGKEYLFAGWYTYDPRHPGEQIWYVADGLYNRGDVFVDVNIREITKGQFNTRPVDPTSTVIGTGRFTFNSCNNAAISFKFPNYKNGADVEDAAFIERLSPIYKYKGQPLCK